MQFIFGGNDLKIVHAVSSISSVTLELNMFGLWFFIREDEVPVERQRKKVLNQDFSSFFMNFKHIVSQVQLYKLCTMCNNSNHVFH